VNLPEALVVHAGASRLRVRIPAGRGDLKFVAKVRAAALKSRIAFIRANATTGSILFSGENATYDAVAAFGRDNGLFEIKTALPAPPLATRISTPLASVNRSLQKVSAGQVDLPGALFIILLFTALYEIARGRFRTPPWYTAFWYAFGLFTKSLLDRETGRNDASGYDGP
jgi:hypothetical protein